MRLADTLNQPHGVKTYRKLYYTEQAQLYDLILGLYLCRFSREISFNR